MPALLTRIATSLPAGEFAIDPARPASHTSSSTNSASPRAARIASVVARPAASSRSVTMTRAPAPASACAIAAPIPEPAPVTSADFPERSNTMSARRRRGGTNVAAPAAHDNPRPRSGALPPSEPRARAALDARAGTEIMPLRAACSPARRALWGASNSLDRTGIRMDQPRPEPIPNPAVRRLSLYLRQLEAFRRKDRRTISSKQLGESLGLTDAQVRKDLAYFGQFGHPGIGYRVDDLIAEVRRILGTDKTWNVILVGAGNLGRALSAYRGFEAKGFRLIAVFDNDPAKVGKRLGPFNIQPLAELADMIEQQKVKLAILAVPAEHAQEVADRVIDAGVRGLLNFAPVSITVPPHVALNAVDLAVQLEQLSFQVSFSALSQTG